MLISLESASWERHSRRMCGPMKNPEVETRSQDSNLGPHDCKADALPHGHGHHTKNLKDVKLKVRETKCPWIRLLSLSQTIPSFTRRRGIGLLKTLLKKEKMLVTSIFSFSYNVFFPIWDRNCRLTLSQSNPGFYVFAVQVFWEHCGKRRYCS